MSTDSDNPSENGGVLSEMPKHETHPVTKQWCRDVRTELRNRGRGAQAELYKFLKSKGHQIASTGHLSDILNGKYDTSDIVASVHDFLGWPKPLNPTASRDAGELVYAFKRMTPEQRDLINTGAERVKEMSGDEARAALAEILKAIQGTKNTK